MDNAYNVIWSMSCVYQRGAVVALHSHPFYHYLYVKDGDGTMKIAEEVYPLHRGFLYMMPRGVLHEICAGEGLVAYEVKFEVLDTEEDARLCGLSGVLDMTDSGIEESLECILTEMMNAAVYYNERIDIRFRELLLLVARKIERKGEIKSIGYSERFAPVLFYMQKHISEEISLRTLAEVCHTERIYFLKRFKADMGMTPMNYLRNVRINEAKRLLEHSDMNITQISYAVGFQTVHHFSGTFKRLVGVSPIEYRAQRGR